MFLYFISNKTRRVFKDFTYIVSHDVKERTRKILRNFTRKCVNSRQEKMKEDHD